MRAMNRFVATQTREMMLRVLANLTAPPEQGGTPRKSGWAASNWIIRIGAPFSGVIGSRDNVNVGLQKQSATLISSYRKIDQTLHLSNNTPHILRLNEGHSGQAPAGFVQAAIGKAIRSTIR